MEPTDRQIGDMIRAELDRIGSPADAGWAMRMWSFIERGKLPPERPEPDEVELREWTHKTAIQKWKAQQW